MLVSHRKRFIYTKTFKTAGTSVEAYFEPWCMPHGQWQPSHERNEHVSSAGIVGYRGPSTPPGTRWWNHMPAHLIRAQLGEETWNDYFKFCVIRNPFEKTISTFFYMRSQGLLHADPALDDCAQLQAWLERDGPLLDRTQYTLDGALCVDRVIRFEMMQPDLMAVCELLSLPWDPGHLPRFKSGIRPSGGTVRAMFTERSEQIVRDACQYEFEIFGYEPVIAR